MSDHLYPTLVADGSLYTHVPDNHSTLQTRLTSKVDKYLQEAAERHERDINYFDGWHVAMNTTSQQQKVDFVKHDKEKIPELIDHDTSTNGEIDAEHYIRYHEELETIPEENDEDLSMIEQDDINKVDTIPYAPEESDDEPIWPLMTLLKTQLLSWANRSPPHSSQRMYAFQLRRYVAYKLLVNLKSSLIISHQNPEKKLLNRYMRYYKC